MSKETKPPQTDRSSGELPAHLREFASQYLAAIVESAEDAIVSKTLEGRITSWNRGAQQLFGYTADEAIGQPVTMLIPPGNHDEEPGILSRIRAGDRVEHYETVRVRKTGELINVSLTVSPIRDGNGKIVGASKIARDITHIKNSEAQLRELLIREQEARAQAEEASRLKDEFLATVSHELRTPLTAILGWSHMLRLGQLDEKGVARAFETIERNARTQAQLIDDLLDIARVTAGNLRLDIRPVDPNTFIDAAIESARPAAVAKGVRIERIVDAGISFVAGDPVRLQQVVWNLISNAIKFTKRGGHVRAKLERIDSQVAISVSDDGAGIVPEFLPLVFERFRQADQATTRQHGGLGLGLSIVKHLVELHGGTVKAESPGEGLGATFTVTLPITAVYGLDRAGERVLPGVRESLISYESADRLDGLKILIVDDEADTREVLKAGLNQCGASVIIAASASEAIELLQSERPDLIISDIGMPDEDGYSLMRQVRALPGDNGGKVPAIALTAYARAEDRLHALRVGYQMHVPKPVEIAELAAVCASLIHRPE